MSNTLKTSAKKILSGLGLKVTRIDPRALLEANRFNWLKNLGIRTIIDVGGSKGNAALQFHEIFPDSDVYSFEPLKDCFERMNQKLKDVSSFKSFNIALSDSVGKSVIHRSSYSGSSSLRKMADVHKDIFPVTAGGHDEAIETDTMDHALASFRLKDNILIKIDVQGLEDKVILGGHNIFQKAKVVIVETSFIELYEGQPLFGDIYKLLTGLGFVYSGTFDPDFKSPIDGASLQQDSVFIRND